MNNQLGDDLKPFPDDEDELFTPSASAAFFAGILTACGIGLLIAIL